MPTNRPAETGGVASASTTRGVITALAVVIGGIPAVITGIVATRRGEDAPTREINAANERNKT
jgi:hypothetical protein